MISQDNATLLFNINADADQAKRELTDFEKKLAKSLDSINTSKINSAFQGVSDRIRSVSSTLKNVGSSMSNVGKQLTVGLTAPIAAVATLGVRFNAMKEQALVSFGVLLKSGDKAKQLFADLTKFAAETPFEINGINQSTKSLLAFGVAQKDIIPTLRSIGDIASGTGTPLNELAELYGKAKVQGRLFAEDINQLTGRGIPIIQELAKQFGVSDDKVKDLVQSGKIGFPQLEKAFQDMTKEGGQFNGMMEAQSKTFSGRLSTLMDGLNTGLGEITEPLFDALSAALPYVIGFVEKISSGFKELSPTMQLVVSVIAGIAAAVGPVLVVVGGLITAFAALLPVLAPVISAVGSFLALVGAAGLGATLSAIASVVGGALVSAFTAALPIIAGIGAVLAGLVVIAGTVVASLVALYLAYQNNFGGIRDFVQAAFQKIRQFISEAVKEISAVTESTLNQIKAWWKEDGEAILAAAKTVYETLENIVKGALDKLKSFWQENGQTITAIIKAAWNIIKTVFQTGVSVIMDVVTLISAIINKDWTLAWAAFKNIFSVAVNAFVAIVGGLHEIAYNAFKLILSAIVSVGSSIIRGAKDLGLGIINGILSALKNGTSLVVNAIKNLAVSAIDKAKNVLGIESPSKEFFKIGKDVVLGFVDGINALRSSAQFAMASLLDISGLKNITKNDKPGVELLGSLVNEITNIGVATRSQAVALELTKKAYENLNPKIVEAIKTAAAEIDLINKKNELNQKFESVLGEINSQYEKISSVKVEAFSALEKLNNYLSNPDLTEEIKRRAAAVKLTVEQYMALLRLQALLVDDEFLDSGLRPERPGGDQGITPEEEDAENGTIPGLPPEIQEPGFLEQIQERLETAMESFRGFGSLVTQVSLLAFDALDALANKVGDVVDQWVLYGKTGAAVGKQLLNAIRQAVAGRLAAIASESAVQAIYATALGFLHLAQFNYPAAAAAFKSAATFGLIAIGSGVAGRLIAGNTFKDENSNNFSQASSGRGISSGIGGSDGFGGDTQTIIENRIGSPGGPLSSAAAKVVEFRIPQGVVERQFINDFNSAGPMRDVVLRMVET